jgi:hypothetical protein
VKITDNGVLAGTKPLVTFDDGISPKDRRYYENLIMEGALAVQNNEVVGLYRFYDEAEKRLFDKIYNRELKVIRAKK